MGRLFFVDQIGIAGVVALIVLLILSLSVHEAAHAWMAWKRGDSTARDQGRMTLNPIPHIDPVMTLLVPAMMFMLVGFIFGGARPVPVNPGNFRNPHADNALVALAGPFSNLLLAFIGLVAFRLVLGSGQFDDKALPYLLLGFVHLNVLLAVFNLLPIPPLDGSRVVMWLLPRAARPAYASLEGFGLFILLGLFFLVPGFSLVVWTLIQETRDSLDTVVRLLI
jgi:Zn-dependent protease